MNCKRIVSLLLALAMLVTLIPYQLQYSYADENSTETESEIGTEIEEDDDTVVSTETETEISNEVEEETQTGEIMEMASIAESDNCGYRSESHDYSVPEVDSDDVTNNQGDLPESYMNVAYLKNNYPATRNQGDYGTCWAFSLIACAEFDMSKNHGFSGTSTNFSELHLAYYMYNKITDPLGGLDGDRNSVGVSGANFATVGGNSLYAINVLAQHCGAVSESTAKYSNIGSAITGGLSASAIGNNKAKLANAYIMDISTSKGRNNIKNAVKNLGAVSISYYHNKDYYYTHSESGTVNYYNSSDSVTNHVVTIVGWDDNYSKTNFKSGNRPSYNGAWLVRNSWTTSTGNSKYSYFWLSYYDNTIADAAYALDFVKAAAYDHNYQYDGAAVHRYIHTEKAANIFTAQNTSATNEERLKAVNIALSYDASVDYKIEIYKNMTDTSNPESGMLVDSATTYGSTSFAGIYTIPLAKEVPLDKGEIYSVVVTFEDGNGYIDRECSYSSWIKTVAHSDKGESFFYDDDEWYDCAEEGYGNISIKAFTVDYQSEVPKYELIYELDGGQNAGANPSFYEENTETIKLANPTKDGYHFLGWYTDPEYKNQITEITYAESGEITLYAKWEEHDSVVIESIPAVSCLQSGVDTYECKVCGFIEEKEVTVPHDTETVIYKATATKDGYSREVCNTCKRVIKTNYTIYKPTVKLSYTATTYSGIRKTPVVTASNRMNEKLSRGINEDYTVAYSNNLYPGTAKVIVKFNKKEYDCTITKTVTIKPKTTSISSISSKTQGFYIKWKRRTSHVSGYQVQYSTNSSFSNAKTKTYTSKYTRSKTIKGLKGKKRYYVRVRTYKNVKVNGVTKKYYSNWCAKKTIKTK